MVLLVWIIATAVAARAWLLFRTPYVPGINGAYYLVQARALLDRGVLGIPDMPLTFHLHAAVAWTLMQLTHLSQADAIIWAVKCCDAALPPLVAWPVFVLVRRWARARGHGDAVPLAAAALACLASPWILIVGELQKNSLALVWLALLVTTLHAWLGSPTYRRGLAVIVSVLLLGLTHIGVLGAALVLLAAVMLVYIARHDRIADWRHILPWIAAGLTLLAATSAFVMWKYDPARIHRLMTAISSPSVFSADGKQGPVPPGGAMGLSQWLSWIGFALVVMPSLVVAWRRRHALPTADMAIVAGGALTVLLLTGPWFGQDKAMRFALIAMLPTIIVGAFALLHVTTPWVRRSLLGAALLVGIGSTAGYLPQGGQAALNDRAMQELQGLAAFVAEPASTLVVAPHGAEWWSAWFLHTRIAQPDAVRADDWVRYERVLFLVVKPGAQVAMIGRGPSPSGGARPPLRGETRPPGAGGGAPPMRDAPIPADAELLHDGVSLKLVRVATPPEFVGHRAGRSAQR